MFLVAPIVIEMDAYATLPNDILTVCFQYELVSCRRFLLECCRVFKIVSASGVLFVALQ